MKNRTAGVGQNDAISTTIDRVRVRGLASSDFVEFQNDDGDELKAALARADFDDMGRGEGLLRLSPESLLLVRLGIDGDYITASYVAPASGLRAEDVIDRAIAGLEDLHGQLISWRKADLG
ncbi:hypothetical protein [Aeromicrobium sp. 179-A 4D2 NHS]|uniref:hypothetical protein n=1 Tax=Aeromicrobium sp. 179-A 4D2 NHS TaxID=3142375 RepID=UPI0039A20AAC